MAHERDGSQKLLRKFNRIRKKKTVPPEIHDIYNSVLVPVSNRKYEQEKKQSTLDIGIAYSNSEPVREKYKNATIRNASATRSEELTLDDDHHDSIFFDPSLETLETVHQSPDRRPTTREISFILLSDVNDEDYNSLEWYPVSSEGRLTRKAPPDFELDGKDEVKSWDERIEKKGTLDTSISSRTTNLQVNNINSIGMPSDIRTTYIPRLPSNKTSPTIQSLSSGSITTIEDYELESRPFTKPEDRKVFFAARRLFDDSKLDEANYNTSSCNPADCWAYMLTMGYRKSIPRLEKTLDTGRRILELRKKYGLGPVEVDLEKHVMKSLEWNFSFKLEDLQRKWPICVHCQDQNGRFIFWDKSGAIKKSFIWKVIKDKDRVFACQSYVVRYSEEVMRRKLSWSKLHGVRMTKHVVVLDVYNVGPSTLNTVKTFVQELLADVQVMYPEVLAKAYLVNAGWLFKSAWVIIKAAINIVTSSKFMVLGSDWKSVVTDELGISHDDIPTSFR